MDEKQFLQRINSGELKALIELHDRYSKNLVQFTNQLINDKFLAHDIVTESFLKIWEQRKKFMDFSVIEHCLIMATLELCKKHVDAHKVSYKALNIVEENS